MIRRALASHLLLVAGFAAGLLFSAVACGSTQAASVGGEDLNRALIAAAWQNDVDAAAELIERGADVNHQDGTQQSAYLIATSEGYFELLELTLANGANVESLDSYNGTGLIRAAERGHGATVELLLSTEIEVNHINRLGWTALHEAILLGDGSPRYVETVQLLLDHGADPRLTTGDGARPLEMAKSRNQEAIVELLEAALSP